MNVYNNIPTTIIIDLLHTWRINIFGYVAIANKLVPQHVMVTTREDFMTRGQLCEHL